MEGDALEYWKGVDPSMMSDVETDDDGVIIHRTLPWRNQNLSGLIRQIDESCKVVRCYGQPSLRKPSDSVSAAFLEDSSDDGSEISGTEEEEQM